MRTSHLPSAVRRLHTSAPRLRTVHRGSRTLEEHARRTGRSRVNLSIRSLDDAISGDHLLRGTLREETTHHETKGGLFSSSVTPSRSDER
jgi:hypothetical protein